MKGLTEFVNKAISLLTSITVMCLIPMSTSSSVNATNNTQSLKLLQYDHIEVLDDGGKIYVYYVDGVENAFPVPPEGFNPIAASDEDLLVYGFPPKPSDPEELELWNKDMELYKGTPIPQIAKTETVFGKNKGTPRNNVNNTSSTITTDYIFTQSTYNWAGYYSDVSGVNNKYTQVQVDYVHPTITGTSGLSNNNVAGYWCGLGGCNSPKLIQAGTADVGYNSHWAWYEYLNGYNQLPANVITSLIIHPGDSIHVYIAFSASLNQFNYYIANNTTGYSSSCIVPVNANEYYDGTTAEWIVEKADTSLPNFGSITMSNCKAILYTSYNWTNLANMYGVDNFKITNNGLMTGTTLCSPGSIFNNNCFTVTWSGYN